MANDPGNTEGHQLVANLIAASFPLEKYLQQKQPLTDLEIESLSMTVNGLQSFIDIWKKTHGKE